MSYFQAKCPGCGTIYWTGMVGTTLMGSHTCKTAEQRAKAAKAITGGLAQPQHQERNR